MADAHELLGQPVLPNGVTLSKIHHAAFDSHLIGIDPDDRVHVSERLLMLHDGPLLEQSPKAIAGTTMRLPRGREDHPDRDRLAARFEQFRRAAYSEAAKPTTVSGRERERQAAANSSSGALLPSAQRERNEASRYLSSSAVRTYRFAVWWSLARQGTWEVPIAQIEFLPPDADV